MKMSIKQLIVFFLTFTLGFSFVYYKGLEVQKHKKRTPLAQASTQSSMAITIPYLFFPNTSADANQVNSDFGTVVNDGVNTIINDIASLFTDTTQRGNNETITGKWIFSSGITSNLNNDNDAILDADNTGAESNRLCYSVNRGSTSANDPAICWTNGTAKIVTDRIGLTLDKLQVADGVSGHDVVTWQQVVKNTGNESIGGDKSATGNWTYSNAITQNVAATSVNHLMRKGEVEAADSAITAGGCSKGAGAPVGSCTNGACYWDETNASAPIKYYCNPSMSWVKQDIDIITHALTINGAVTQAADFIVSGIRTLNAGANKWTNVADPTSNQDVLTLNYFNNNIGDFVWGNGADGSATISMNTSLTSDKYYTDLTIDAGSTLTLNGYVLHASGTLTWNGTIAAGNGANASGKTAGTNTRGSLPTIDGKNGGSKGTSSNSNITGNAGQSCNVDSSGGDGISASASNLGGTGWKTVLLDVISVTVLPRSVSFGHYAGSASGDGSIWNGTHGANTGGDGGGSGANGQTAQIIAKNIVFGGASSATGTGGNGANGGNGVCDGDGMAEGGGVGGSAGSGSLFDIVYKTKTGSLFSSTLTGGTKGTGGIGCGGGGNGLDGMNGNSGAILELDL